MRKEVSNFSTEKLQNRYIAEVAEEVNLLITITVTNNNNGLFDRSTAKRYICRIVGWTCLVRAERGPYGTREARL